jgi:hypothetical protein
LKAGKKQMRPNTQNPVGREAEQQHNVSTIAPGTEEQERIRLSELRGNDRSGSNAAQANVPDKSGAIYHTETGANKTGKTLSRNASRITVKSEKSPIIGSGAENIAPHQPKSGEMNHSPAVLPALGWKAKQYATEVKDYKVNADHQEPSLKPSRKPKSVS